MLFPGKEKRWLPGVLSKSQMKQLIEKHYIGGVEDFNNSADHSSIDLHISNTGYRMKTGSIKPFSEPYDALLEDGSIAEKLTTDPDSCYKLEPSNCYVFELKETLLGNLNGTNIYGQATAKSSIGRLDVISRLIVDGMSHYEHFDSSITRATTKLFIEIIPISFPIRVKEDSSLVQLRLFNGHPDDSFIQDKNFIQNILIGCSDGEGYLTVDLSKARVRNHDVTAFCACECYVFNYLTLEVPI